MANDWPLRTRTLRSTPGRGGVVKQMGELISWKLVPLMTRLDVRRERDYDFERSASKSESFCFRKGSPGFISRKTIKIRNEQS